MSIKQKYYLLRKAILKKIVPEIFWPKVIKIDNVPFKIRNMPYSFGTKRALKKGIYEIHERNLLRQCNIFEDDVIIEMGGSIGVITAILSDKLSDSGFLFSIEADKKLTNTSQKVMGKKNIRIVNGYGFPVFRFENEIRINKFEKNTSDLGGIVHFDYNLNKNEQSNNKNNSNDVTIYTINSIIKLISLNPTVLVIDIEGSEKIILDQKPNFPKSIRLIIIELHPDIYSISNQNKIIDVIQDEGFMLSQKSSNNFLFEKGI
jgi:FkbM family methyltransferase